MIRYGFAIGEMDWWPFGNPVESAIQGMLWDIILVIVIIVIFYGGIVLISRGKMGFGLLAWLAAGGLAWVTFAG
jgi:hypothetical protein